MRDIGIGMMFAGSILLLATGLFYYIGMEINAMFFTRETVGILGASVLGIGYFIARMNNHI